MTHDEIKALIAELEISFAFEFVPFSRSRNAKSKHRTFEYKVTLKCAGRVVLVTEYGMGVGHSPNVEKRLGKANQQPARHRQRLIDDVLALETETGRYHEIPFWSETPRPAKLRNGATHITPEPLDVLSCLISDASILDVGGFKSWCAEYGYDDDSIKARATYDACLEDALTLQAGLGRSTIEKLQTAFQDY